MKRMIFFIACLSSQVLYALSVPDNNIKLVTGDDYFPFAHHAVPSGGWSKAIVEAAFTEMGLRTKTDMVPWNRGLMWVAEGKYLGTYPYIYSEQRHQQFIYSQPINKVPVRIYVSRKSGITNMSQLQGKRLCLPHGYSSAGIYTELTQTWNMVLNRVQDGMGCIRHVEKGWSDVGLTNGYLSNEVNRERFGIDATLVVWPEPLDPVPLYFIIARTYPDAEQWMSRFNAALDVLEKSGRRERIDSQYRRWLSQ